MNIAILFSISALSALGGRIFSKICSNNVTGGSKAKYTLFLIVNGAVACLFFWVSSGLHLALNLTTLLYSAAYAAIVTVSLIAGLMIYRFATIAGVNILSSAVGLVGSLIAGVFLFNESVDWRHFLRIGIMLLAAFFVFLDTKRHEAPQREVFPRISRRYRLTKILVLTAMLLTGLGNTVITKAFAMSERVTDENSFFFLTNALIIAGALVVFVIECIRNRGEFSQSIRLLRPKQLVSLAGNTVCSNVGSLVSIRLMALMAVSVYTPVSAAVGIFLSLIGSWIFREKLGVYSYLAAAISVIAVIL